MNPALLQLILLGVEEAVKLAPQLHAEFQTLFAKEKIEPGDWAALRLKLASQSYEQFVPASDLPKADLLKAEIDDIGAL